MIYHHIYCDIYQVLFFINNLTYESEEIIYQGIMKKRVHGIIL